MKIPYIYQKILAMIQGNGYGKGTATLADATSELSNVRISREDAMVVIRELEKFGVITIDVGKENQHTRLRVVSKGYATAMWLLTAALFLVLGLEFIGLRLVMLGGLI